MFQAIKAEIPGDTEFEKRFAIAKVPRAATARYYLQVLERQARGESEPEFVPNPDETEINLEHVLPQNPKKGTWTKFDEEMRVAYSNRIGNFALFKRSENHGFGNDEFADKKANLAASSYSNRPIKKVGSLENKSGERFKSKSRSFGEMVQNGRAAKSLITANGCGVKP